MYAFSKLYICMFAFSKFNPMLLLVGLYTNFVPISFHVCAFSAWISINIVTTHMGTYGVDLREVTYTVQKCVYV
jgi:hypothetical protein